MAWDPTQYEAFRGPRTRPALDLIGALPAFDPDLVVDLGCGTGRIARLLAERFPAAAVQGVDSSASMLAEAAAEGESRIEWRQADIARWAPDRPVGLLFSNAALHWLPDHAALFRRLLDGVAPGGVLAVQMPRNFAQPSHALMRE